MSNMERYMVTIPKSERHGPGARKRAPRCPVCEKLNSLKQSKGMILCTHCFWATELQQAG